MDSKTTLIDLLDAKNIIGEEKQKETKNNISTLIVHGKKERKLAVSIFNIVLNDWMYSFGDTYNRADYALLFNSISDLVIRGLPIRFFLPGFPCKSSNTKTKVLGAVPDYAEFLAIQLLLTTARKIEAIYPQGVVTTILSDYHTFDEHIGVAEETYQVYHDNLNQMIHEAGGDDVIEVISLSNFPEFKNVPGPEISQKLSEMFGGREYMAKFDEAIKDVSAVLEKYMQMKKFMLADQSHNLPGTNRANSTRKFIKQISRGMMSQGVALDNFLRNQTYLTDYIRLSIHSHHPKSGKFPIDLFKKQKSNSGILRTPWHHAVVFDTKSGEFGIDHKKKIAAAAAGGKDAALIKVQFNGKDWLYLRLYFSDGVAAKVADQFTVQMIKGGCGIIVQNSTKLGSKKKSLKSSCINTESLTNLIKEFGLVVLRGFDDFEDEESMINFYASRAEKGLVDWEFGPIHKVTPSEDMPGYVNSNGGIPIHFDLVAPPRYMDIAQSDYMYKDYICREFLLYCKETPVTKGDGGTTFVDAAGAVLALTGTKKEEWKKTVLTYETKLKKKEDKESYFGGSGNVYEYPLVHVCPWTGKEVLRWWQTWSEEEHPDSPQHNWSEIKSSLSTDLKMPDLENEIRKIALDERFFFSHSYEQGDQVYVNNYTTLHGRNGFSNRRELWRLQAIPPSKNLPKHFTKS